MKKKITTFILAGIVALSVCGCDKSGNTELEGASQNNANTETVVTTEDDNSSESSTNSETELVQDKNKTEFLYGDLKNIQFDFSSGAGAWSTELYIHEDGSFEGTYHDGDMGSTGEGYPNGTRYFCEFNGQFAEPVKVNDYTYSLQIEEMQFTNEVGTEEILDEVLYVYSDAYGLQGTDEILIYLPESPVEELPEGFMNWVRNSYYYEMEGGVMTKLPSYGLYNEAEECGFSSYNIKKSVETMVAFTEEMAAEVEYSIQNDDLTQTEYNFKARDLYDMWDADLNTIWSDLKLVLDEKTMEQLLNEQREWIKWKEEEVEKAGADYEGGSMQPMVMHLKAAELTKARVYELMKCFE